MREPEQAQFTPVLSPAFVNNYQTFKTLGDYENYERAHYSAANPPGGSNGIYGQPYDAVQKEFFDLYQNGGGVTVATRALLDLTLPFNSSTNKYSYIFDRFSRRAILSLPDPPNSTDTAAVNAWWGQYGELFTALFDKYGVLVVVKGALGGEIL